MTESFERQVKSYKLWTWLFSQLQTNDFVPQNEIIEYGEKNKLGSKKSILSILNEFICSQLIQEIELTENLVGRPRKAYKKYKEKEIDMILLNLAELPPVVKDFVQTESEAEKVLPTDVIIKLVSWAYTILISTQYSDNRPIIELPEYLKQSTDPLERLINK